MLIPVIYPGSDVKILQVAIIKIPESCEKEK